MEEFQKWDDKQVRKAAAAFAFSALVPKAGREATTAYRFTLAKFILEQRTALFLAQKSHAGSDFAKGVKRLARLFHTVSVDAAARLPQENTMRAR